MSDLLGFASFAAKRTRSDSCPVPTKLRKSICPGEYITHSFQHDYAFHDSLSAKARTCPLKVLLLYYNDPEPAHCSHLDPAHWRTKEQYCDDMLSLAETLTKFSVVEGVDEQSCPAFTCVTDGYDVGMVDNWLLWTEKKLREADCVLLACSPSLHSRILSSPTIPMQRAVCSVNSLVNTMPDKPFYPIFVNMPRQPDWIPTQLKNSSSFQLNISAFHEAMGCTDGLDEESFIRRAYQCFQSDSQFADLLALLRNLRGEFTKPSQLLSRPALLPSHPSEFQSDECLLTAHVKSFYTCRRYTGPIMNPVKFINLALIKKPGVTAKNLESNAFVRNTLHGNIDDIPMMKKKIEIGDIFKPVANETKKARQPRKVLVEGGPGIGKTVLAEYLCKEWAEGRVLKEFGLVLLVPLRKFASTSDTSLSIQKLVELYLSPNLAKTESEQLERSRGKKSLIILEGWDELPSELRKDTVLFYDMLNHEKLPEATVLITSRPTVAGDLHQFVDKRIEVLGFLDKQIEEYIKLHIGDKADYMQEHFRRYPVIKAFAHIPLTLTIMCKIVEANGVLPPTETLLYEEYIYQKLLHNMMRLPGSDKEALRLMSKGELFAQASYVMQPLATLALEAFHKNKFVFTRRDLCSFGIDSSLPSVGLGLLNSISSSCEDESSASEEPCELFYHFRHLSIQEYLAAQKITQLDVAEQRRLLASYRHNRQFYNIWKFLAGISQLQDDRFHDAIVKTTNKTDRKDMLLLYHCLYESQSPQSCQKAALKLKHQIDLSNSPLNVTDCLCIAYVVAKAGGRWFVDLRACGIGDEGLKIFWHGLEDETNAEKPVLAFLDLSMNNLDTSAAVTLAGLLESQVDVVNLKLEFNHSLKGEGVKRICQSLHNNKYLRHLRLSGCNMEDRDLKHVCNMLEKNSYIQELFLGHDSLGGGEAVIGSTLAHSTTLKELSLVCIGMTKQGLWGLANGLAANTSVEMLRIDRNGLGPDACVYIVKIIREAKNLRELDISKNPIRDEGFVQIVDCLRKDPIPSLRELEVFKCEIGPIGVREFASYLKETTVFAAINLGENPIRDKGALLLIEAIKENHSLKTVAVDGTRISTALEQALLELNDSMEGLEVTLVHNASILKRRKKMFEFL